MSKQSNNPESQLKKCSFCGKLQTEVRLLIQGPEVLICETCTQTCVNIIERKGIKISSSTKADVIDLSKLGVRPRFRKVKFQLKAKHLFLACPFAEPFDTIYADHIKPICRKVGLTIERADEIFSDQPIIEDIWEAINSCQVMLADVTGRNPNVMYEIGMAHTVGKPVVILSQEVNDIPFDLKHYRCIIYSHTPRGCKELEAKLEATLTFLVTPIPALD